MVIIPTGSNVAQRTTTGIMTAGCFTTTDCVMGFTGSSTAPPLASGISALVVEANPNITWLEFQYIMKMSAVKNDHVGGGWTQNGAGLWVSHNYGFGIIDSSLAVKNAKEFQHHLEEVNITAESNESEWLPRAVSKISINHSILIHHVEAVVTIKHPSRLVSNWNEFRSVGHPIDITLRNREHLCGTTWGHPSKLYLLAFHDHVFVG
eukprot:TRINITY_DN30145_c0_g1_i1.p1 TRINITY_DN30145_c0_g1~~TRINITY_DN30145_c0_g1_i1.p1  ORF type:complete len:207 (-),score=23.76 TRINITY_DN30145_c0_g1_i1:288-908(-)